MYFSKKKFCRGVQWCSQVHHSAFRNQHSARLLWSTIYIYVYVDCFFMQSRRVWALMYSLPNSSIFSAQNQAQSCLWRFISPGLVFFTCNFFFKLRCAACGISISWWGIEPVPLAVEAWRPNLCNFLACIIETYVIYHTIHPFKVYSLMAFGILTELGNYHHNQGTFSPPEKETL